MVSFKISAKKFKDLGQTDVNETIVNLMFVQIF
jgi:hypothetical protein